MLRLKEALYRIPPTSPVSAFASSYVSKSRMPTMRFQTGTILRRSILSHATTTQQRRTFLGLQQTPPPRPRVMGFLVVQGLAVVLLVDYGFAMFLNHTTITRKIAQSAGIWRDTPSFEDYHKPSSRGGA